MASLSTPWLSFDLREMPEWQRVDVTIPSMIRDITDWRKKYESIKDSRQVFLDEFIQKITSEYIEVMSSSEKDEKKLQMRKPNTGKAMDSLQELHKEMDYTGLLTDQRVNDIHRILLKGLHPDRGNIRKTKAYTSWKTEKHEYPLPDDIEVLLRTLIDRCNDNITKLPKDDSAVKTEFIFKCAAELMVRFTSIHPYGDGNGRMCRLLANYIVGLITPFPVSPYYIEENRSKEEDYINAIVRWRKDSNEGPYELAAMLVEGAWHGWKLLFTHLERSTIT